MSVEVEHQKFDNLSLKFSSLLYGRSEKHLEYLNFLLDDLNNLNYKLPVVTNINKAVLLIHQICTIIPPNNDELVKKSCVLIINLVTQQKIAVEHKTLTVCVQWIIQYFKAEKCDISALQCLECLIRDNVDKIQEYLPELISPNGILINLSTNSTQPTIQLWAVKCLEAISYCKEDQKEPIINLPYLQTCYEIFLRLLETKQDSICDDVTYCKIIISSLRGLQTIINQTIDFENYDLGVLLGISHCYMTYYLYNSNWIKPKKILPSNLSIGDLKLTTTAEKKGGKVTKQRKHRKSNNKKEEKKYEKPEAQTSNYIPVTCIADNIPVVVSDSDFSDSESGKNNRILTTQGKVRQAALNLLLSLIKVTEKNVFFGYWSSFVYDGSPGNENNLNNCLLKETLPRGKITILIVFSSILHRSKLYLSQAESSEKQLAFTPFSIVLGQMIEELHKCLCLTLKENSIPVLTQNLKCLALLIQATPYHRLSTGLLSEVIGNVKPFIRHRDTIVQVAALIVLGCIVASEPPLPETIQNLTQKINSNSKTPKNTPQSDSEREIEYAEFSSDDDVSNDQQTVDELPWLLEKCLRNLGAVSGATKKNFMVPAPVKLESLQVISAMARNFFNILLAPYLNLIAKALEISLNDKYVDLRLHAGRAVDSIGHYMQVTSNFEGPNAVSIDKCIQFWLTLLKGPLTALLQSEQSPILRSIGCDCLGTIGGEIFEHLPKNKQLLIITLLFNSSRDEESSVKGAAVRALAISVLYPSLREDLGFIMDTAEAITRNLSDSNLSVRIKSSWSLGNLSDALVLYKANSMNEDLPNSLIHNLIINCIKIVDDNNKIKSNAVRALGNLLRLITNDLLREEKFKIVTSEAIEVLVKNSVHSSDMKVRWNSCYAIGNFMRNNDLFSSQIPWEKNVYPVLMDLVSNFRNFKVRINAALALSIPEKRSHYSNFYFQIWKSLLEALENSENIADYTEFKHRDNLVDQICLSLSHLTTFLIIEDLFELFEILMSHMDNFKTQMNRVQDRLVPEKSIVFLQATNHIRQLRNNNLTTEQVDIVSEIENIFVKNYI